MAIFGKLEDVIKNYPAEDAVKKGLLYLFEADANLLNSRDPDFFLRGEIDGERLFCHNSVYVTRNFDQRKFEGHRRYADIQYIVGGAERVLVAPREEGCIAVPYDEQADVAFYKVEEWSELVLGEGMVGVFYPEDLHAPCLNLTSPGVVRKIVVKVLV